MHTRATITHRTRRPGAPESVPSIHSRRTVGQSRPEHSRAIRGELSAPTYYGQSQGVETTRAYTAAAGHNRSWTRHCQSFAPSLRGLFGFSGTPTSLPARVAGRSRHGTNGRASGRSRSDSIICEGDRPAAVSARRYGNL